MPQPTLSDMSADIFNQPVPEHNDPLWDEYVAKAKVFDERIIADWNKIVDVTLVFVGLIIAVLSAFIIDTSRQFQPKPADITNHLLIAIYDQLIAQANNTSPPRIDTDAMFKLDKKDYDHALICNALLYSSLGLCSVAAMLALAAKLWVISYGERAFSGTTPYQKAMNRQKAYSGILAWKMGAAIQSIPLILLIALVGFGFFVHVSITAIQKNIGYGVGTLLTISVIALGISSLAAAFIPSCPYNSSFSTIIRVIFKYIHNASRRWRVEWGRMAMVIFSWFASGSLIAYATITYSSAFYLLVFIPITITFEYSMNAEIKLEHTPQKHRLPPLSLGIFLFIAPILAIAGYFRNPQKYYIFVTLYILGMLILFFYGWMASRMSKSLDKTAEIDAITWLLKLETSPNPELFKKACGIVRGPNGYGYQPKILESLMPFFSDLIVSHPPNMAPTDLELYVSCLAYLVNFESKKGSCWKLYEDATLHPELEDPLKGKLVELAKNQSRVGRSASEVLRFFEPLTKHKRQRSGAADSVTNFVESANPYEEIGLHSRYKGAYRRVDA